VQAIPAFSSCYVLGLGTKLISLKRPAVGREYFSHHHKERILEPIPIPVRPNVHRFNGVPIGEIRTPVGMPIGIETFLSAV